MAQSAAAATAIALLSPRMASPFQIDTEHDDDGRYRLALAGELDLAAAPSFLRALETACADGARSITVDLSGLTFIDSAGLRAVLQGHRLCFGHGSEYWLDPTMAPPIRRLLEIAGVRPDAIPFLDGSSRRRP